MDEMTGKANDGTNDMLPETVGNASPELRKRRSTRIVQAVPIAVTGVDALGRPFTERTSTLIINCHGCRYQSKHYVLKNMWVALEIPNAEAGEPPRTVRGRVAWIQRPRTVRQLFQVALELETPGNAWGIAFPPEDWSTLPAAELPSSYPAFGQEASTQEASKEADFTSSVSISDADPSTATGASKVRAFPSPASATDASLQLARHLTRLVADAKQQIQAAAREAASQAISAERRASFEQWEQKFAAARTEVVNETARATEKIQQQAEQHSRVVNQAAAEALRVELPRFLESQLEQLTRQLTAQLAAEGELQRSEHANQLKSTADTLRQLCEQTQEATAKWEAHAQQTETQIAERVETAAHLLDETIRRYDDKAKMQWESLAAAANDLREQIAASLSTAKSSWQEHLKAELSGATDQWQQSFASTLKEGQESAQSSLRQLSDVLGAQLQEETTRQTAALHEAAQSTVADLEKRLATARAALDKQTQRLEASLSRASEISERLEQFGPRIATIQRTALQDFQTQLDDVLNLHRNELHRRSESLFQEIEGRIRAGFEEASRNAAGQFDQRITSLVQPHISQADDAVHRLAGGGALLDAALTLQQERIRASADEAFAEALKGFRENLGSIEQILQDASQTITGKNLAELEEKVSDLKHQSLEELFKSTEWYEKKAQTQIQNTTEKSLEHLGNQLREKAGELSGAFSGELDHCSRGYLSHTQTEMENVVRDAFERARILFVEAADTTSAAFTDEIQRTARHELDGFTEELRAAAGATRTELDVARADLAQRVTAEQQDFLQRFQIAMAGAMETGVAEAHSKVEGDLAALLDSWKAMIDSHQTQIRAAQDQMNDRAAEQYRGRLENVSNQWMLATVTSLDHQSRDIVASIAASAEEKLRDTCTQVFSNIGENLRNRLQEIAAGLGALPSSETHTKTKSTSA